MKVISLDKLDKINELCKIWQAFKKKRNSKCFEFKQKPGYLTVNDREDMLDKVFSILQYNTEEVTQIL